MHRVFFTILAAALLGGSVVYAQEPAGKPPAAEPQPAESGEQPAKQAEPPGTAAEPADPAEAEKPDGERDKSSVPDTDEKTVLDDQTFEGEDDEFIPTEEIPLSEPIPFPVDI